MLFGGEQPQPVSPTVPPTSGHSGRSTPHTVRSPIAQHHSQTNSGSSSDSSPKLYIPPHRRGKTPGQPDQGTPGVPGSVGGTEKNNGVTSSPRTQKGVTQAGSGRTYGFTNSSRYDTSGGHWRRGRQPTPSAHLDTHQANSSGGYGSKRKDPSNTSGGPWRRGRQPTPFTPLRASQAKPTPRNTLPATPIPQSKPVTPKMTPQNRKYLAAIKRLYANRLDPAFLESDAGLACVKRLKGFDNEAFKMFYASLSANQKKAFTWFEENLDTFRTYFTAK